MFKQNFIKILNVFEWFAFVILLLVAVMVISPVLQFKKMPRSNIIVSGSMEPAVHTGSLAITTPVNPAYVKVGDIIVFNDPSDPKTTILHRVAAVKEVSPLRLSTKGDANNALDNWDVTPGQILGKFAFSIPYLGYVGAFARKPLGFGLLIGLPALIFVILQLLDIKKAINQEVEKRVDQKITDKIYKN
jgi:signal peptidase I